MNSLFNMLNEVDAVIVAMMVIMIAFVSLLAGLNYRKVISLSRKQ